MTDPNQPPQQPGYPTQGQPGVPQPPYPPQGPPQQAQPAGPQQPPYPQQPYGAPGQQPSYPPAASQPPQQPPQPQGPYQPTQQYPQGPYQPTQQYPQQPYPGQQQYGPPPGGPRPPKRGFPAWAWWLIGGGVLLVILLIVGAVIVANAFGNLARPAPVPTPAPTATESAPSPSEPDAPDTAGDLPDPVTMEAGSELPADLQPGFSATFGDTGWDYDLEKENFTNGTGNYLDEETGCTAYSYQTLATDLDFVEGDDHGNSIQILETWFEETDLPEPGSYFIEDSFDGTSVEFLAIQSDYDDGSSTVTISRGFAATNIAMIAEVTCPSGTDVVEQFEQEALVWLGVSFLPAP